MNHRIPRVLILALIVLLAGSRAPGFAQDDPVIVAGITAGGVTHLVIYPADSSGAAWIETALPTIITTYETLWNAGSPPNTPMPFRLLINLGLEAGSGEEPSESESDQVALPVPSAPEVWEGQTESTTSDVCQIQLFDRAELSQPQRAEFELALSVARCYLQQYTPAEPEEWWYEGLSMWMAINVYNPPADVLADIQDEYEDNYNSTITDAGQEAVYFWEFLLSSFHPENTPLPADVKSLTAGFNNWPQMFLEFTPDLFYGYAQVVASNQLPWQPEANDLAEEEDLSLPDSVELDLEESSIYLVQMTLPELKENQGVSITAQNLANSGTLAAVASDGGVLPLVEGVPLDLCDKSGQEVMVLAGRGMPVDPGSIPLEGPSLEVTLKDPCEKKACWVGTWRQDVPYTTGLITTDGVLQFTFQPDGSFVEEYQEYVVTFNNPVYDVTYHQSTFTGGMTMVPDPNSKGGYSITNWGRQMEPGGNVTMTIGGQTRDATADITIAYFGDGIPTYVQCATDDARNTRLTFQISGNMVANLGAGTWTFTRVP